MEKKQNLMRRISFIVLVLFIVVSCSQKDKARIKVQLNGLSDKTAILQEQRVDGTKIIDTLKFSGSGRLRYSLELRQPGFYNFTIPGSSNIYLLLSPGDKLEISGSGKEKISNLKILGSPESEKLNVLYDSLFSTREILSDIRAKYTASVDALDKERIQNKYLSVLDKYRRFSMQFVLDNLRSLVSVAALYQEVGPDEFVFGRKRDVQFFKLATDSLTKYFPKHSYVLALERNFKQMMESINLDRIIESTDNISVGLPDVELPGLNGSTISMKSMKERYILLNFWEPADQVSKQIFPSMNSIYKKYHSKNFGIYNVYLGKSLSTWSRIVNFEEIKDWVNVADTSFPYSKTRMQYNIVAIPSNYLIDSKESTIIGKDLNPEQLNQVLTGL
jgi:hypothetical protein